MSLWAGPTTPEHKNLHNKDFKETFGVNGAEFPSKSIAGFLWFKSHIYRMWLGWKWASMLGYTCVYVQVL